MKIEDELHPNNLKLIYDDDSQTYESEIVDLELDNYKLSFMNDGSVEINTEDYTHILLDINKLETIIQLIEETNQLYIEQEEEPKI